VKKENAMDALRVMIGMSFLRVILPITVLLILGEWASRRGRRDYAHR
jgi:hypothetical protein